MKVKKNRAIWLVFSLIIIAVLISIIAWATVPEGASIASGTAQTATAPSAGTNVAQGGYINNLNLSVQSQSHLWQGYFGQVVGNITLEDTSGNLMYRWAWNNTDGGEVYASEDSSPTWTSIVAGSNANVKYVGGNSTSDSAVDTFTSTSTWTIANKTVTSVPSTTTYNSSDIGAFNMGILSDGADIVFVSTLYNNLEAFNADGNTSTTADQADFQLMVPVNETVTVTYYLWLELS